MRIRTLIALLFPCSIMAQAPTAELDSAVLRIGEQVSLFLSVDLEGAASGTAIDWPVIGDSLNKNVEVIRIGPIDTVRTDATNDIIHLVREVNITSFDTGFWAIAPFRFTIDGEEVETAPLLLEVRGVDLGEGPQLRDIKAIHEVPFSIVDLLRTHWYWIVIPLLVAALLWWAVRRWRARPAKETAEPVIAKIPVHERILGDLQMLEKERLWQNGAHKEYHSRLTDLLREYIEERYQVPALERTTDELLQELRVTALSRDHHLQLRNMLELSDMVKFAKARPSPSENEQMMAGAIRFVKETSPLPMIPAHA